MRKFNTLIVAAALSLAALPALASGFGAGVGGGGYVNIGGWDGSINGYAESTTTGGSMAQGIVNGDGFVGSFTGNAGGSNAYAGATFSGNGVNVSTGGESFTANIGASYDAGNGYSQTAGGVGTDYNGYAGGEFSAWGAGVNGNFGIGGFIGFVGF